MRKNDHISFSVRDFVKVDFTQISTPPTFFNILMRTSGSGACQKVYFAVFFIDGFSKFLF